MQANVAQTSGNEVETLLMARNAVEEDHKATWYIDTNCSNHMSGSKE